MILKNILWDYFGKFSSMLMQLITSFVLMRQLERSDFGLIGMTLAINGLASTFTNFGFASYIIQQPKEDRELESSILWFNLVLGIIISSLIILFSPSIANFYNKPELQSISVVCCLFIPITLATSVPTALLGKRLLFKQINIRAIIVALISGIIGITAAYLGYGVWSLVLQQGINLFLNLVITYFIAKWKPTFIFNKQKFMGAFHFGKFIFLSTLVESIYSRLDVFTIGKIYGFDNLGSFSRAQSLSGNVVQMSSKSILNVFFPTLSKIKGNKEEMKKLYFNFFHHICFVFCIASTICFVLAEPGFNTFFKPKWLPAALLFKIIILSSVILPLSELMLSVIEANGNSKNYFLADIWKKVILYPTYLFLYFFNIKVFLYVNACALFGAVFINLFFLNKEIEVGYYKSIKIFLTYFLPSLILSFILDRLFVTGALWSYALLKLVIVLTSLFISLHFFPSPTLQAIVKKIKR